MTNPRLTGLVLVVVPLVVVPIVVIGRRVRLLSRGAQDRMADVSGAAEETVNAIRTVQSFAQEERESARFAAAAESAFAAAARYARARALLGAIIITLVFGAITACSGWAGRTCWPAGSPPASCPRSSSTPRSSPAPSAGSATCSATCSGRPAPPSVCSSCWTHRPRSQPRRSPTPLPAHSAGALRFEHVSFAYPSHPDRLVLGSLDLDVRPGETVALVGPSGAGKTSVFQLLMRYYDPSARSHPVRRGADHRSSTRAPTGPDRPRAAGAGDLLGRRLRQYPLWPAGRERCRGPRRRRGGRRRPSSSTACRTASPPSWARRACACPAVSGSGSPSPAPSSAIRPCCCWTRPPARSTPRTSAWCSWRSSG